MKRTPAPSPNPPGAPAAVSSVETKHVAPGRPVHHLYPATGSLAQVADERLRYHAHRAGPVRKRLYHLHAYGFDQPVGPGHQRGTQPGSGDQLQNTRLRSRVYMPRSLREHRKRTKLSVPAASFPHVSPGEGAADRRPVQPLRADLEADRCLPDGRCQGADGFRAPSGERGPGEAEFAASGTS